MFRTGWLLAATMALAVPAHAQSVRAGVDAWQKGDLAGAIGQWRPLAEKGDADAAFNLGQAYRLGKGVPLDLGQAQRWYELAARKGHVDAATSLGILLFQNGNQIGAMRWLHQAADKGEPRALLLYGTALYNGDGVKADPVRAYAYISWAAAQGFAPARATLADMDEAMSVLDRQKGVALAKTMAGGKANVPALPKAVAVTKPVVKPAAPPQPTAKPTAPATSGGGWRVQLGAFGSKAAAQALYGKLQGKLGGAGAYYVPVGAMTRLQAGPYSKADAAATCARLKPQPCFPVASK